MISIALIMLGGLLAEAGVPQWAASIATNALGSLYAQFGPALQAKVTGWLWAALKSEGPVVARAILTSILSSGPPTDVYEWCQQRHAELRQDGPASSDDAPGP